MVPPDPPPVIDSGTSPDPSAPPEVEGGTSPSPSAPPGVQGAAVSSPALATFADGVVQAAGIPSDGAQFTIGATTYTFRDSPSVDYDVEIGGPGIGDVLEEVYQAVTGQAGYAANADATIVDPEGSSNSPVVALEPGADGNSIATTSTSGALVFGAATLAGGTDSAPVVAAGASPSPSAPPVIQS